MPTRYPLGHAGAFEQGCALVNIYSDGTVLVSIGGIEMGQGLNVKCLQIAARALKIPIEKITIFNMDTSRTPNSMPTGGSQGTDVFGLAVKVGLRILNQDVDRNYLLVCRMPANNSYHAWSQFALRRRRHPGR
jgi:xanthine dehydrogenase/oxidase